MSIKAGEQLDHYRILELIGAGGMGQVYVAEHVHLRKQYALKVLPGELASDRSFIQRFYDEARVMAELSHPHLVPVHNMGVEGKQYFLVMDYVTGPDGKPRTLQNELDEAPEKRLNEQRVLELAKQIAEGLAYAHERGVIHRDLKPANVLLNGGGKVKITDFGLAKAVGEEFLRSQIHQSIQQTLSSRRTIAFGSVPNLGDTLEGRQTQGLSPIGSSAGSLLGTYDYMAPEQREGGEITPATDVYAFGVMLYRMLTGKRPVGLAKPPSKAVPGLSKGWDEIVAMCLDDTSADRYADGAALNGALAEGKINSPVTTVPRTSTESVIYFRVVAKDEPM